MELGDGPGLSGTHVLQVERPHQVVVAPDMLRNQVDLWVDEGAGVDRWKGVMGRCVSGCR